MSVKPLDIHVSFNKARFEQAGSSDCANWHGVEVEQGKTQVAYYPAMGRKHVELMGETKLVFFGPIRAEFRTLNYMYVVVGTSVYQVDRFYNQILLSESVTLAGDLWFTFLAVGTKVYSMLTDGKDAFVISEDPSLPITMTKSIGDTPSDPTYVAAFGNRFVVTTGKTPTFTLSQYELGGSTLAAANKFFTIPDGAGGFPLFAQASGVIGQLGVLHNQLYIFTDDTVDVWANIPTQLEVSGGSTVTFSEFPFKKNTAYNWDYGIADPNSLDIDFGIMVWLAKNRSGLVMYVMSTGGNPVPISNQAVNTLLESQVQTNGISPFLSQKSDGFLYQWENSVFYRVSAGKILDFGEVDIDDSSHAIEYNFNMKKWYRVIEKNGDRNKIQKHVYFNNKHFVTVDDQTAIYEMRGDVYTNEIQTADNPLEFITEPMRYELTTGQVFQADYSEFETDYVEIDFVFGDKSFYKSNSPFLNAVYIVDENGDFIVTEGSTPGTETFVVKEGTDFPTITSDHYRELFNPHIELYYSDDGGVVFHSADVREFSQLGVYRWRMRWYQLGPSRNRVYKLIAVSGAPIVILGAVQDVRRLSGGAN